jgi:hypothetical protein
MELLNAFLLAPQRTSHPRAMQAIIVRCLQNLLARGQLDRFVVREKGLAGCIFTNHGAGAQRISEFLPILSLGCPTKIRTWRPPREFKK